MLAETSLSDFIGGDWVYASFLFWPATFNQAEQYGAAHSLCGALGESAGAMSCGRCGAVHQAQGEDKQGNWQKDRFWKSRRSIKAFMLPVPWPPNRSGTTGIQRIW